MKIDMNRVQITGFMGSNPDIRIRPDGKRVLKMSLATHRRIKEKTYTDWHKVVSFREEFIEIAEKQVERGSYLYVEGRLQTRKWEDKKGDSHTITEIMLDSFEHKLFVLKHEKYVPIVGESLLEAFEGEGE